MAHNSMRMNHRARILIVDNHAHFGEVCKAILEPQFKVVGLVVDGSKLAQAVTKSKPDIVIIDMIMPSWNGLELGEQVKAMRPEAKIIYMTAGYHRDEAAVAFRQGAFAYVNKSEFPEELLLAVRRAIRGDLYLSPKDGRQLHK